MIILNLLLCSQGNAAGPENDESLLLYLKMNEGKGSILHDSSGYHNHAKSHHGQWEADKTINAAAMVFDGKFAYCFFNTVIPGQSVELWFMPLEKSRRNAYLIHAAGKIWSSRASRFRYGIFLDKNLILKAIIGGNHSPRDVSVYKTLQSRTGVTLRKWHHCALVLQKDKVLLFLDGRLIDTKKHCYRFIVPNYTTIGATYSDYLDYKKGTLQQAYRDFFPGKIRKIKIYDRILSSEEIQESSKQGLNNEK
ncbi:MAG: LamG-like jellyroll fold domain-containing protein [Victivallales bacterium]